MLYIGEKVGAGKGPAIDIALDPLEGTTLTAKAMANALAVVAFAPAGGMLHAPDTYMDKIAIGPGYAKGLVDLDKSPAENVKALAKAKGVEPDEITVCILDRPRHAGLIESVRSLGARVLLITDGDVAGVINTTDPETGVDLYVGQGGAPEGVLAAAALKCVGGQFQGRLVFRNDDEKARARRLGLKDEDFGRKYELDELVTGEAVFCATGVTTGALLDGVKISGGFVETHTLVMDSASKTVREIRMKRPV
jgi:fructose-1,6-bisphosphatase II / sedoheptulose-1,7-bisphosphatase